MRRVYQYMLLVFAVGSTGLAGYIFYLLITNYIYNSEGIIKTFVYDFGLIFPFCAFSGLTAIVFQLKALNLEKPFKTTGIIDEILIEQKRDVKISKVYAIGQILFCVSLLMFGLIFVPGIITRNSDLGFETFMLIITPVFFGASGLIYTTDIIKKLRTIRT